MTQDTGNMDDCAGLGDPAPMRPPADAMDRPSETHFWFEASCPLGTVFVTHFRGWVSVVRLAADNDLVDDDLSGSKWSLMDADTFVHRMPDEIKVRSVEPDRGHDPAFKKSVREALREGRTDVPIDLMSLATAPRYREALQATTRIPRGETLSYGQIANLCESRGGQWAGNAMNSNPVPFLIPCHRVSHSDRRRDEWGYGSNLKKKLLAHERDDA